MTDASTRLSAALAARYLIERELGAGEMDRSIWTRWSAAAFGSGMTPGLADPNVTP